MNSSRSKGKKFRQKVIIRCRKLSSTSYRNQTSCSCGSAPYKQRMKVMSKNNKELATSLQGIRCDLANKEKYLNNMMYARVQMLKMRSSMISFMKDFDQVLVLLNTDNTEWPALGCSLQSNEFKNKMNNVIETVEEVSEPESSFAAPKVSNKITDMTVEEIVAKAVLNSHDSKKDQDSAAVNHTSTTPMPESKVLKEAVFNEELSIDALSKRKSKEVGPSAIHLSSLAFKSYSSLGKSSDLKSGFPPNITVSPSSAKNILTDPSAEKSKKSKIPKIHNVLNLNKAKNNSSMSRKTSKDKRCLKEIITKNTENIVTELEDSQRLNSVKDSDIQVPDSTSSNDILEVPSSMKLSDEVPSILQEPDETARRQTFIIKDVKSQCDRRKTFVKKPQDTNEMFIPSKDRRETFTISNKIDENNEGFINHGMLDATNVCDSGTAKSFKNEAKPKIGIIKALHTVNDGVLNNLEAIATDSQAILTEVFAVENIPSLDSNQKIGSDICEVDENIKKSKKLSAKKCSELQEKAKNPGAACVNKVVDFELDLCKETADNSEATSAKLIGSELNLCTAKTDHREVPCTKLCYELDLCQKNNPEAVCAKLMGSELNNLKEKADNSETPCANLIDSASDLCKKKSGSHRAVCAKIIGSKVTEINMDECAASTDDTSQKLKTTGNVKRRSKVSGNAREKSVDGEIDTKKRASHCNFKRKLDKQVLSSESDGETIQGIDLDSLEVPPLKITPVIRRFPKAKNGKVFVFHGNKRRSILSKVSKSVSKLSSDAVCQSNDSSGNIKKLNISDASLISTKNVKNSKKSVSFCFSTEIDKIDTLCTDNSTIQQKIFNPSYVESIENVIKECGEIDCEKNYSDNCSPMFDIEIDQSEKIPTKLISSEMECKENVQSKDSDADNPNFNDWFESICKDIVKPAEIKIKKRKKSDVNKKSKRGASKKAIRTVQEDVIFPNINGSNVVKDDHCKIETKKIKSKVKKYLPVNTFVVEAEIHPPPPSAQNENEIPLQLNKRLSVVLSDIFKSEDGETLNIPCNKEVFLKGSTNFPLKVPFSENAANVKPAVDDLRKDIPVIDLDSEKFEDLTDARCRRSRKTVTYKEPSLNKKMRRLK